MATIPAARDQEGYLLAPGDWSPELAAALAANENIELQAEHWEVINLLREFYAATEVAPAMRPLVKLVKENLGADKGNSIYLMTLFSSDPGTGVSADPSAEQETPQSPAKIAAKLAGLPRPAHCL